MNSKRIRENLRNQWAGLIALFLVLSTTGAYAAGLANDSVRSKHIKDGQVKTADVRDEGLTNLDLGPGSVATSEIAADSVGAAAIVPNGVNFSEIADGGVGSSEIATDGVGKPELAANTVGSEELLAINEVVNTQSVPSDGFLTVTATCPAGQQILTGGFSGVNFTQGGGHVTIQFSRRAPGAWEARYGNSYSASADVSTYAYCLSA